MKKRHLLIVSALLLGCVFLFVGCGGNAGQETNDTESQKAETVSSSTVEKEGDNLGGQSSEDKNLSADKESSGEIADGIDMEIDDLKENYKLLEEEAQGADGEKAAALKERAERLVARAEDLQKDIPDYVSGDGLTEAEGQAYLEVLEPLKADAQTLKDSLGSAAGEARISADEAASNAKRYANETAFTVSRKISALETLSESGADAQKVKPVIERVRASLEEYEKEADRLFSEDKLSEDVKNEFDEIIESARAALLETEKELPQNQNDESSAKTN